MINSILFVLSVMLGGVDAFSGTVEISFGEQIETCLSQEQIWRDLRQAMTDSQQSYLWPNRTVSIVGDGIANGATMTATYKLSIFYWPNYNYRLENVVEGQAFSYVAQPGHPFEGGATISIEDLGESRVVNWQGRYITKEDQEYERSVFKDFLPQFFSELNNNFAEAGKMQCPPSSGRR